jgi:hypothetical protein
VSDKHAAAYHGASGDPELEERFELVKRIDVAIGGVLFNASNFPARVQPYLLGQNVGPLRAKILDAVLAAIDQS